MVIDTFEGPVEDLPSALTAATAHIEDEGALPSQPRPGAKEEEAQPRSRYAGREGAFNGPSFDDAHQYMMGTPASKTKAAGTPVKDEV